MKSILAVFRVLGDIMSLFTGKLGKRIVKRKVRRRVNRW